MTDVSSTAHALTTPAEATFIKSPAGDIFVIYFPPLQNFFVEQALIIIPPFAEEMNKSRRMFSLLARSLNKLGYGVVVLDLYGTGDSPGDFADSRWGVWRENVHSAVLWLRNRGIESLNLLGLRLGALLAADYLVTHGEKVERLVFWQPVLNGKLMMNQFLRLRLAASMMSQTQEKESTAGLRDRLGSGECIEVAGYDLSSALVEEIDGLLMEKRNIATAGSVHWFEVAAKADGKLPPVSRRVIDAWRNKGLPVDSDVVAGIAFWSSPEIAVLPELIEKTAALFSNPRQ